MRREIAQGWTVAFTIDGPRGPRFVAKPGPVLLARATGAPMVAFHIALQDPWVLNTWDRVMIPKPFSRALLRVGKKIQVPDEADDAARDKFHGELQAALERVRVFAEGNVGKRPWSTLCHPERWPSRKTRASREPALSEVEGCPSWLKVFR